MRIYAKQNRSYGLTTLHKRHLEVDGAGLTFAFKGKSGVEHCVSVRDRRLAHRGQAVCATCRASSCSNTATPTATCAPSPPTT